MLFHFCKYFFTYIFFSKTRQKLLFLAIVGLILSSFSLLVLQSTMGGLQRNLILRSKNITGFAEISIDNYSLESYQKLLKFLDQKSLDYVPEYNLEALLRFKSYLAPVILHGIDEKKGIPKFLGGYTFDNLTMGFDLASRLRIDSNDTVKIISPAHVDPLLGDLPRYSSINIGPFVDTGVPEIDGIHIWTRASFVQNLIFKKELNLIRIYSDYNFVDLKSELKKNFKNVSLSTWEENNQSLVFALNLETTVMVFLFVAMSGMVSLSITSGLMIFFDKVKLDLASFWILGAPKQKLGFAFTVFLNFLGGFSSLLGIILALVFLYLFDRFGGNIMPEVFVERKIPVFVTPKGIAISFGVPYIISMLFSYLSLIQFKKDQNLLDNVRAVG